MARFKTDKRASSVPAPAGYTGAQCNAIDIDVTVLTKVNWPAVKIPPSPLPAEVVPAAEQFKAYYLSSHSGRKLAWHTEKGTADIVFHVDGGKKHELCVSTWQMCLLLMFNSGSVSGAGAASSSSAAAGSTAAGEVSFAAMQERLGGIPRDELMRHVLSLMNPKLKVLNKTSKGKEIEDKDTFTVNTAFSSNFYRVKIPLITMQSAVRAATGGSGAPGANAADEEGGDVHQQIDNQRKNMTQASIVRIMKARKTMDHANLVAEVTKQLQARFRPM